MLEVFSDIFHNFLWTKLNFKKKKPVLFNYLMEVLGHMIKERTGFAIFLAKAGELRFQKYLVLFKIGFCIFLYLSVCSLGLQRSLLCILPAVWNSKKVYINSIHSKVLFYCC